ncbi:hypothetical protein B488_04950 [Liberibacter crescens BT-1]|uniref:Uncharacterized protein n=1 Tax=Liberibacter crescens (strain BT-1) TaxID=1215343 RepID=L0EU56_LIBCB|nr:hypothetical protein [Liberibacter crescens]AGA64487.1 hypothetical protein B488_04950 [Liberibacter crescens BT-1]
MKTLNAHQDVQITSLPLSEEDRIDFIERANEVFETVMLRIEPFNPELTRKLWSAEDYIDNHLLKADMLPIGREYALSLIEAFLWIYVVELAAEADEQAEMQ